MRKLLSANKALRQSQTKLRKLNNELEERVENRTWALSESEARFRAMAEGTDILIVVADETSKVIYFNKAWERLTGRSAQTLLSSGWVDLVHPEDKDHYVSTYLNALKDKLPFTGEFRIKSKDGEYHWLLAKVPARFRQDGTFAGYIGSCVDITALKEEEQRKDDFISIASHELKTPLTSLKASLQLMTEVKNDPSPKLLHKLIRQSNVSVIKMTALVDDLLNANRANEGQLHINKLNFRIAEVLGSCCNEIRVGGNHDLIVIGDKQLEVYGDENRIEQVLVNMVNNAAKYAPGSRNIYLITEKIGDMAKISVKDNGPGIDAERIPYLFDRYYRADYAGNQYSGLGLGLYISAEIVKRHGGDIGVESEPGKGSTFWFTLPVA
ncbi:MAG: PAS domain-containing sensor histidine kinase [Bacteroidota bacterium]|nr:PAS domain-containing sensor histidine kinase [Bacteroidota bacterium]